jgi:hypothetical protein
VSKRALPAALWFVALAVTALLVLFQRATGPSYPLRGTLTLADGTEVSYRLPRSDQGRGRLPVALASTPAGAAVDLEWRRYPTDDPFVTVAMEPTRDGGLEAVIPGQPPAGKVEYRLVIRGGSEVTEIPAAETVVARFRGDVPAGVLIPHIITMFVGMLVATRALLEVIRPGGSAGRGLVVTAMILLGVGGLILGPVVQKYAFGALWTGWPLGHDLTDNKTLIGVLAWLPATVLAWRGVRSRAAIILGWIVMMGVFLIPHSLRGSELDWSAVESGSGPASEESATTR